MRFFEPAMRSEANVRAELEREIGSALRRGEFEFVLEISERTTLDAARRTI